MNYQDIKKLIDDMGNSKIDSLDIEFPDGIKIRMKKEKGDEAIRKCLNEKLKCEESSLEKQNLTNITIKNNTCNDINGKLPEEKYNIVKSPMVGTFYSSNSPKEEAFVKIGDKVKKGQVLCIIEAMKLMNEIESEFDGEIVEICAKNEDVVEYGMPLFKIK